nr:hypothetical protein [Tanacetum cinerariifolium]
MKQFWSTVSKIKETSSYLFKLDKKKCRINVEVFRDILQICPRLPNQEFNELPSDEEIISFIKELGYKGDIGLVTKVYIDHMHQPWRTFAAIINKCLSRKTTCLDKIRLSRAQILWGDLLQKECRLYLPRSSSNTSFSKDKSISLRNRMFMHTVKDDSVLEGLKFVAKSEDTHVYGALIPRVATGATTPNKARKWKKPASPSKKQTFVITKEPAKKPAARR